MLFWKKRKKEQKSVKVDVEDVVRSLVRNEIAVETNGEKDPEMRGSRIGGRPYVPHDFVWPTYAGENYDGEFGERPLAFLCQINLSEVAAYDTEGLLPKSGMMYFFYECETMCWGFDPKDRGCARVFYFDGVSDDFAEAAFPEALAEEYRFAPMALCFSRNVSCPSFEEAECHTRLECAWDVYDEAVENVGFEFECERHKLLGYADVIQDEMLTECERVSRGLSCGDAESYQSISETERADIRTSALEWTLLFQLSSVEEDGCEMMWGDCGNLYFYIKKSDLQKRDFSNVWLILQCG